MKINFIDLAAQKALIREKIDANIKKDVALEIGKDLKFDKLTMRQLKTPTMPEVKVLTPVQIRRILTRAGVSLNVMARYLNISPFCVHLPIT